MPAAVAGSRIHTPAVLIDARWASTRLIPVERRLGGAEEAVVVGGVAGLAGHPRDREVVAVVGRDRPDHVPQQQGADDADVGQPGGPARRASNRRHARGARRPDGLSSIASATIEASTQATPSTITASLSAVGVVMNRVSMSMRADRPGLGRRTFRSVKMPATCGFFSGGQRAGGAGDADEVRADAADVRPRCAARCRRRSRRRRAARRRPPSRGTRRRRCRRWRGRTGRCGWRRYRRAGWWRTPGRPRRAAWRSPGRGWSRRATAAPRTPAAR